MTSVFLQTGAWLLAVACVLMAGIYFAFSSFIMTALGRVAGPAGVEVMQEINVVIVRSPFIVLFVVSTLGALALAIAGVRDLDKPCGLALTAGGAVYAIGMFGVTVLFNVPLNNELAALNPHGAESSGSWANYLSKWTGWNHVRTVACVLASGLFGFAAATGG